MKLIRPALGHDVHYRAAGSPELSRIVTAENRDFFVTIAKNRLNLLSGDRVVIIVRAVDQLIVGASTKAVDVELGALNKTSREDSGVGNTGQREDKVDRVQSCNWQVHDL